MSTASDASVPDGSTPEAGSCPDATASDGQPAATQEYDIEVIRDHLGNLLSELGVRRDEWRPSHILRRLPFPLLLLGLGAVGLGAGVGIWQWRVHVHQRDSWLSRAQRLSLAAHRAIQPPDDVAKTSPNVAKKIATAVAVTAAGMVTRRFLRRYLAQFTHAHAEHTGSRSGRLSTDQTARSSEKA
jgi:hypothetical protein